MSRSRSRERDRRKRLETALREAVTNARNNDAKATKFPSRTRDDGELWQVLREIERWDLCVWDVARTMKCTDDEKAMIEQAVAPRLAAMTRTSVLRRREQAL